MKKSLHWKMVIDPINKVSDKLLREFELMASSEISEWQEFIRDIHKEQKRRYEKNSTTRKHGVSTKH